MTDRELLAEARDILSEVHYGATMDYWLRCKKIAKKIDTALADHSPDAGNMVAMELAKAVEAAIKTKFNMDEIGCITNISKDYSEAAALIESYGRRVPREMLFEIEGNAQWNGMYETITDMENEIAAKYGVKIEED